jgi:predicted Rossmann fold nucleotide-binding protein DprA/Smf involved in DNA uptake
VTRVEDVFESFGIEPAQSQLTALGDVAAALLGQLASQPLTADELVRASGVGPGEGAAALVELELAGRVTLEDGVFRSSL